MKINQLKMFPEQEYSDLKPRTYYAGQRVYVMPDAPGVIHGFARIVLEAKPLRPRWYYVQDVDNQVELIQYDYLRLPII